MTLPCSARDVRYDGTSNATTLTIHPRRMTLRSASLHRRFPTSAACGSAATTGRTCVRPMRPALPLHDDATEWAVGVNRNPVGATARCPSARRSCGPWHTPVGSSEPVSRCHRPSRAAPEMHQQRSTIPVGLARRHAPSHAGAGASAFNGVHAPTFTSEPVRLQAHGGRACDPRPPIR